MQHNVIALLQELRAYALGKGIQAAIFYHEEESYLMRFANSAISLNTNEHLVRLQISVFDGNRRADTMLLADPGQIEPLKRGIDVAAEMAGFAEPLSYTPSIPVYPESVIDMQAYDPFLACITNAERLEFFNTLARGLETEELKLSGVFSNGITTTAQISTESEHTQYFACTDASITAVLSHQTLKWEVNALQSAQAKTDLDPERLRGELAFLVRQYSEQPAVQLPLGKYTVVFGAAAVGDVLDMLNWFGPNGGMMKRGYSFLSEAQLGKQVFSPLFTLTDDPRCLPTYPVSRDLMGKRRERFPLFEAGVLKAFFWNQDDADEFGAEPTGHSVYHNNLVLSGGEKALGSLEELAALPREEDILYIPYLHYMNIVNPTAGILTGSSRFGALLLRKDGSVAVPYNVRITQSFADLFGERLAWLSREQCAYNVSNSYGMRNPRALLVPRFLCVRGIEISHSNSSY
ncbi:MAG: metallopeptidase TldD-related protein [Anaerolineaceae bacterium]